MKPSILIAATFLAAFTACNRSQSAVAGGDPANGNLAPAPVADTAPAPQAPAATPVSAADYESAAPVDQTYADVDAQPVEAPDPPPPLPEYDQPPCPGDNYLWTPGYWSYASSGYYWVPGAWVMAPWVGALWTPPWWGFSNNAYVWHAGYWGPHIGFYGGIDYGFGYTGRGYYGAYWNSGRVVYNRSVTNVNVTVVHNNIYNYSVPRARGERVSYNGGRGGLSVRPTPQESAAQHDRREPAVAAQVQHAREAAGNREQFSAGGRARPATLAAPRPLPTNYRAPAERAPEHNSAPRVAQPNAPESRPNQPFDARQQGGRPQPPAPSAEHVRPEQLPHGGPPNAPRPAAPEVRPAPPQNHADRMVRPEGRPQQPMQQRPAQQEPHQAQPPHPVEQRPEPQHQARPAQPEHPVEQQRPQPQREARPAQPPHQMEQQPRPAQPHEAPHPHPEQHQSPPPEPKKKG